jgi:glyoxylase I family protein
MEMNSGTFGFHHIAIRAKEFDRSLAFYTQGLGCVRVYGWGEGKSKVAMLDFGNGCLVELFANSVEPREADPSDVIMHFALRVEDVDAAFERALSAGGTEYIRPKPVQLRGDYELQFRNALIQGPSGEIIEFLKIDRL